MSEENTDIIFHFSDNPENEVLRITPAGEFFVEGRKVTEDMEIYNAMSRWAQVMSGTLDDQTAELVSQASRKLEQCAWFFNQIKKVCLTKKVRDLCDQAAARIKE